MTVTFNHAGPSPRSGAEQTTQPPTIAAPGHGAPSQLYSEFVGYAEAKQLFGLSRTHLYRLKELGLIRSVTLRTPGTLKGRRLWHVQSIREMLYAHLEEPKEHSSTPSQL
jgi:hypothetical protein